MWQAILLVAGYIALAVWLRNKQQSKGDEESAMFDSALLAKEVEALSRKMQKLQQLDEMIIDLRLCKPAEVQRAFRMEWMGAAGKNHSFDFMADGSNLSTQHLLELAIAQREELNADIKARIFDLYAKACELDYQGSDES